jgi:hypothetical protein
LLALNYDRTKWSYYYTMRDALIGILKSGKLLASHVGYLNDSNEQRLIWTLLQEQIDKKLLKTAEVERKEELLNLREPVAQPL